MEHQSLEVAEQQVIKAGIVELGSWGKTLIPIDREQRCHPLRFRYHLHRDTGDRRFRGRCSSKSMPGTCRRKNSRPATWPAPSALT